MGLQQVLSLLHATFWYCTPFIREFKERYDWMFVGAFRAFSITLT